MKVFNSSPIVMETLWFSLKVNESPLFEILEERVRQIAIVMRQSFVSLLEQLQLLNASDKHTAVSIEALVAHNYPDLEHYGMQGDPGAVKTPYHTLKQTLECLSFLNPNQKKNSALKRKLQEFEYVYREFENRFISEMSNVK